MTLVGITGFKPDVRAVDRLEVGSIPTPSRQHKGYCLNTVLQLMLLVIFSATMYGSSFFTKQTPQISKENVLALTWQENFCKLNSYKKECKRFRKNDFGWNHFVLHGLWPQPRSKHDCSRKFHPLSNKFFNNLKKAMPSAISGLHKHEWRKHGSCYSKSETAYFNDAIILLNQVNRSYIRNFFILNRGKVVTKESLNMAIKKSFGNVVRKVQMVCKKGLIMEIRFSLKGDARKDEISQLLNRAKPFRGGCQRGRI